MGWVTCPFQSQLGSIGASADTSVLRASMIFQSQLGSIGADLPHLLPGPSHHPFNPSLVRLARLARPVRLPALDGFQSQLGSIGAWWAMIVCSVYPSFQSQLGSIGAS